MKKSNYIRTLVGVLCILFLILVAAVAIFLDSRSPDPVLDIFQTEPTESTEATETDASAETTETTDATEETADEQITPPPQELPATVVLPTQKDPQTGEPAIIRFPCRVPGYDLVIEKLAPYSGMFVEDGSNVTVSEVAMLLVTNEGDFPVEYAQICIAYGEETLTFDITALPVGERMVVQEKNAMPVPDGTPASATALVVQRAELETSREQVLVTDNGDNTLTVQNLTDEMIPAVRVFYKYYMEDEDVFVGGIAFTVRITRLAANGAVVIQPSHYTSQTSRVVMVLTYE